MNFFDKQQPKYPLTSVSEYRKLAQKRLPQQLFDFIDGGAFNEMTLKRNQEDFNRVNLRKRILRDVSTVDTSTEIFGQKLKQPVILAPIGFAGTYARRGEILAAHAAEKAGVPFSLSCVSICSIAEVSQAVSQPFWYQYYLLKDKGLALEILKRAEKAKCPVLLLTVDLPAIGARHRYARSSRSIFSALPFGQDLQHLFMNPHWFFNVRLRGGPFTIGDIAHAVPHLNDLASMRKWMSNLLNPHMTWNDLEWIRQHWSGKIVLKGILDPQDARIACEHGVDGIVVSNHGARHLDSTLSTIAALPSIVDAVQGRMKILFDGGITNGLDVVKALACGANACMIGRAWAFALAARGEQGVSEILQILHNDLKVAMVQLGVTHISQINNNVLAN